MPRSAVFATVFLLGAVGCNNGSDFAPSTPEPSARGQSLATIDKSPRAKEAMQACRKLMNEGLWGKSPNPDLNAMSEYNSWSILSWELVGDSEVWFSGSMLGKPGRRQFEWVMVNDQGAWKVTKFKLLKLEPE